MLFSIIVPVYNVEKFISRCLESIKNQHYYEFEAILVDDGSTDNSGYICDTFASYDKRFRVIHKSNGGVVSARKTGLLEAKGDYIVTVDGDDFIGNNHLDNIFHGLEMYHYPDVISFGYTKKTADGEEIIEDVLPKGLYEKCELSRIKDSIIYDSSCKGANYGLGYSLWRRVFKKDILMEYQLAVNESIDNGDDLAVIAPLLQDVKAVAVIENYEYYYIKYNNTSITTGFRSNAFDNLRILTTYLESKMEKKHQNSIDVYASIQIWRLICIAALHFDCYRDYIEHLKHNIDKQLNIHCVNSKIKYLSLKEAIRFKILKHKLYVLPWIFSRHKR